MLSAVSIGWFWHYPVKIKESEWRFDQIINQPRAKVEMIQNGLQNSQTNHPSRHSVRKGKQANRERLSHAVCLFYIKYTWTDAY